MQDSDILLRPVAIDEIEKISELGKIIWEKYYPPVIGQAQVDYMLLTLYNNESLLKQILEKAQQFYFIISQNKTVGFLSVTNENKDAWMLNKFYILDAQSGNGLGTSVLEALKKIIQPKKITLTVNRKNYKSINFYFKNGFVIESAAVFDIGNGFYMDDFIMTWNSRQAV